MPAKKNAGAPKPNPNCVGDNVSPPISWTDVPAAPRASRRSWSIRKAAARRVPLGLLRHPRQGDRVGGGEVSKPSDKYVGGKSTRARAFTSGRARHPTVAAPLHLQPDRDRSRSESVAARPRPAGAVREAHRPRQGIDGHHRAVHEPALSGSDASGGSAIHVQNEAPLVAGSYRRHLDGGVVRSDDRSDRRRVLVAAVLFESRRRRGTRRQMVRSTARSGSICGSR